MQEKKHYYISCKGNIFRAGTEIKSTLTHKQFNVLGFFLRGFFYAHIERTDFITGVDDVLQMDITKV